MRNQCRIDENNILYFQPYEGEEIVLCNINEVNIQDNMLMVDGGCYPLAENFGNEVEILNKWKEIYPNGKPETINIESIRQSVISAMATQCEYKIVNEFYSDCLGESLHFGCKKDEDQQWIMGKFFKAQLIKQSNPELADVALEALAWKNQVALQCFAFSPNQMIALGEDMETHLAEKKNRFYELRIWALDEVRTVEELENWVW